MKDHFIKNIEIKKFKCFDDFKAEGFARVNLICGKNSVGKTALMEAVCSQLTVKNMEAVNYLKSPFVEQVKLLPKLEQSKGISIPNTNDSVDSLGEIKKNYAGFLLEPKRKELVIFISSSGRSNYSIINSGVALQNIDKAYLNKILNKINPRIDSFEVIKGVPYCRVENKLVLLTEVGAGVRNLISLVSSLYVSENGYLFIDEIENGIHYTMFEIIWGGVLKLSKELNVQVFVTTHSIECIKSYAKVAKKLSDKEITYTLLSKLKDGSIDAGVYDSEMLMNTLEQDHEVRGW